MSLNYYLPEEPIFCYSDRVMLQRILINIISNAIKFTDQGIVTVEVSEKRQFNTQSFIIIKIKDTGIGIDKKYHNAIFDPFFRVESAETSRYSGVGLGLSNVHLMLNKLNGQISVDSSPNEGSTFIISLTN